MHVWCICAATAIVCYEIVRVELSNDGDCETIRPHPANCGRFSHTKTDTTGRCLELTNNNMMSNKIDFDLTFSAIITIVIASRFKLDQEML